MMLIDDVTVLTRLLRGQPRDGSHAENLEAFYAPQANRYDHFRARLLHGREALLDLVDVWPGDRVVELGGGTGSNLDRLGKRLARLESYDLVDLCPSLLNVARERSRHFPTANIRVHEADATTWRPAAPADVVLFSYSLTMIPNWEAALDNALAMLKRGGKLAVVDFHLAQDLSPAIAGFWRRWFAHDGVHLSREHLPALQSRLETVTCIERKAPVPYLPGVRVPYYLFIGRKP
ncbi:MAG: methyltransferase domain-containing protein [Burkholderiales bacterium]|nr:methyltransferase domain-containing protein [Burkholderiales bacterium]